MDIAVDFEYEAVLGAVEINHKPINDLLSSELETQYASVSQEAPCERLSWRRILPKLSCAPKLDGVGPLVHYHTTLSESHYISSL